MITHRTIATTPSLHGAQEHVTDAEGSINPLKFCFRWPATFANKASQHICLTFIELVVHVYDLPAWGTYRTARRQEDTAHREM